MSNRPLSLLTICLLILIACTPAPKPDPFHILYTANLNCALDDCQCGGDLVGGMTRIIPLINDLRSKLPNLLVLDGGDFLSSYPMPSANRVMLQLMDLAGYDAIGVGEQDLVEGLPFLVEEIRGTSLSSRLVSSNIKSIAGEKPPWKDTLQLRLSGVEIVLHSVMDPACRPGVAAKEYQIRNLATKTNHRGRAGDLADPRRFSILIYHGSMEAAQRLTEDRDAVEVVLLAHNQQQYFVQEGRRVFMESGTGGEYVGLLKVEWRNAEWQYTHRFIPVQRELPVDGAARELADAFYDSIEEGSVQ